MQVDAAVQVCVYGNYVLLAPPSTCMLFPLETLLGTLCLYRKNYTDNVLQSARGGMHCCVQANSEPQLVHKNCRFFFQILFAPNLGCIEHSHNSIFPWNFQKFSVKIAYATVD